jgi:pimeloyl-ACP methyl ester carboxylesterase
METNQSTAIGEGFVVAGRWLGRAALGAGRSIASAYRAIDPDVRRHVAQLPLASLSWLTAKERPIEPLPDDGHAPILFVHGLGGHRGNFLGMQGWLRLAGRKRTYALGFASETTLHEMAGSVQKSIRDIVRQNRLDRHAKVDIVAHSLGGLVARLALEHGPTRARVGTLVTLGSPHGGTYAARFGATARVKELRPGSPTLRKLERQVPWHGQPRLVCLWSRSDVLLLPPTSACIAGAENVEMTDFTHYSYLLHPRAGQAVLEALGGAHQRATPAG